MSYIVCGWYTPDYEPWLAPLVASLERVRAPYDLVRVEKLAGGWERNTLRKPEMIAAALHRHPGQVVIFLDVDAVVRAPLDELATLSTDIGVHMRGKLSRLGRPRIAARSGTMVLCPTARTRAFVGRWQELSSTAPWGVVDQRTLMIAMTATPGLTVTNLPVRYCATAADRVADPVIAHDRASAGTTKASRLLVAGRALLGL
ncbi:MAG: hypothetical protein AB7U66_18425 [Hyphomicrobiaceae bacterium]|uniref:hypothetical protein n=1 Tax=Bradyrhizobium sp. TaxID=376 RepID=UPI003D147D81